MSDPHPFLQMLLERRREAKVPDFSDLSPAGARELMAGMVAAAPPPQDLPELASVTDETLSLEHGRVNVRRYRPLGEALGTCIFFHAGGWMLGDLDTNDRTCRRLAGGARVEVVSVDYRLSPEHPWPAPLDDCFAVTQWAARSLPRPLFVAGESAGGNLAAAVAIRARDEGGPEIAGQIVIYGVMDHDFATPSYVQVGDRSWMLTTADMRYFWDHYCPATDARADPRLSPLRVGDPRGLPPLLIVVGELDVLRDECIAYADKLAAAGVPTELRVDPGMLHGYFSMTEYAEPARASVAATIAWIGRLIAARHASGAMANGNAA